MQIVKRKQFITIKELDSVDVTGIRRGLAPAIGKEKHNLLLDVWEYQLSESDNHNVLELCGQSVSQFSGILYLQ